MSAVFSALKDVDGIEKAKNTKSKVKNENNSVGAKTAMKLESTQILKIMSSNAANAGKSIQAPILKQSLIKRHHPTLGKNSEMRSSLKSPGKGSKGTKDKCVSFDEQNLS